MKKVVLLGLIVCLFTSCNQNSSSSPKIIDGRAVCFHEKYGVEYASSSGEKHFFYDTKCFRGDEVAITLVSAQIEFEKEYPNLECRFGYTVGPLGDCLVITYTNRTSSKVLESDSIYFIEKYGVDFASSGERYLFYDRKESKSKSIAVTLAGAQVQFEKEHPELECIFEYTVGKFGDCLVATYREKAKPSVEVVETE
ncbi:MAG: hypothetical protein LBO09_07270 [Candidatus Peribacteria bacterium]|jgi:hypothetical protein|nr:hypothetical protein [Candidatus Peribacteria bacterium]